MGKIIKCDFRRTDRRTKIDKILEDLYYIANIKQQENPNITEDEIFKIPSVVRLQNLYADLVLQEQEWGGCKYWK